MAQVYVSKLHEWYQALAGLKNHNEKDLEGSVLKYAQEIFTDYIAFQSGFTFINKLNPLEKSDPDVLLISKDFSEWIILELELVGKPLNHTKMQLRVFSNPDFDIDAIVKHCQTKETTLVSYTTELRQLFKGKPKVMAVFDTYHNLTFDTLKNDFPNIHICVFEIYRTYGHGLELYRFSGDYPYVGTDSSLLKFRSFFQYEIKKPRLLTHLAGTDFDVLYNNSIYKASLKESRYAGKSRWFLNIPHNNFPVNRNLYIQKSISGKFILEII